VVVVVEGVGALLTAREVTVGEVPEVVSVVEVLGLLPETGGRAAEGLAVAVAAAAFSAAAAAFWAFLECGGVGAEIVAAAALAAGVGAIGGVATDVREVFLF